MQEARVWFPGPEDHLQEEMAAHSSVLAWEKPMDRGAWWDTVRRLQRVNTTECSCIDQIRWGVKTDHS